MTIHPFDRILKPRAGLWVMAPLALSLLAGCGGLAGTAATTGATAAAQARDASQAKATEDRVKQQLEDAQRAAARQRQQAEDESH